MLLDGHSNSCVSALTWVEDVVAGVVIVLVSSSGVAGESSVM